MGDERQVRSARGLAVLAHLRELCRRLPGVHDEVDGFGHSAFKAGKKSFVIVGESEQGTSLSIKADLTTQASLVRRGRWIRTPYIGQHGWVTLFDPQAREWDDIDELVIDAWRAVAPRKLLKQHQAVDDA